jgi:hypothetical protein
MQDMVAAVIAGIYDTMASFALQGRTGHWSTVSAMPQTPANTPNRPTMQPSDLDRFTTLARALRELRPPVDLAKTFMAKPL